MVENLLAPLVLAGAHGYLSFNLPVVVEVGVLAFGQPFFGQFVVAVRGKQSRCVQPEVLQIVLVHLRFAGCKVAVGLLVLLACQHNLGRDVVVFQLVRVVHLVRQLLGLVRIVLVLQGDAGAEEQRVGRPGEHGHGLFGRGNGLVHTAVLIVIFSDVGEFVGLQVDGAARFAGCFILVERFEELLVVAFVVQSLLVLFGPSVFQPHGFVKHKMFWSCV